MTKEIWVSSIPMHEQKECRKSLEHFKSHSKYELCKSYYCGFHSSIFTYEFYAFSDSIYGITKKNTYRIFKSSEFAFCIAYK